MKTSVVTILPSGRMAIVRCASCNRDWARDVVAGRQQGAIMHECPLCRAWIEYRLPVVERGSS